MDLSRVLISVVGTNKSPHHENWLECAKTWVPYLRKLGYKVVILLSDNKMYYEYSLRDNLFLSKCDDGKEGLFYKKVLNPIKWILENNDFDYYFTIDSDSFVHPTRFENMLYRNFYDYKKIDYMGTVIPYSGTNPNIWSRIWHLTYTHASGCAYMISRKSMEIILETYEKYGESIFKTECYEDCVVGNILQSNKIPLLSDTKIYMESPFHTVIGNPHKNIVPYIGDETGRHLAIQHYVSGHMEEISHYHKLY
jgi:hypothetical protein